MYGTEMRAWDVGNETIRVFLQDGKVIATSERKGQVYKIGSDAIRGVPKFHWTEETFRAFLRDTTLKTGLDPKTEECVSLWFSQRARGGMVNQGEEDPKMPDEFDQETIEGLKLTMKEAEQVRGKHVIMLMGVTGTGKSCLTNILKGITLKQITSRTGEVHYELPDPAPTGSVKMGKDGRSTTYLCGFHESVPDHKGNKYSIVDCGGFLDTNGFRKELVVTSSVKFTLEEAEAARVLFCVVFESLRIQFSSVMKKIVGLLLQRQNSTDIWNGVRLVVTKPGQVELTDARGAPLLDAEGNPIYGIPDSAYIARMIKALLARENISNTHPMYQVIQQLIANEGEKIVIGDFSDQQKIRTTVLNLFRNPSFAPAYGSQKNELGLFFSPQAMEYFRRGSMGLVKKITDLAQGIRVESQTLSVLNRRIADNLSYFATTKSTFTGFHQLNQSGQLDEIKTSIAKKKSSDEAHETFVRGHRVRLEERVRTLSGEITTKKAGSQTPEVIRTASFDPKKDEFVAAPWILRWIKSNKYTFEYKGPPIHEIVYDPSETDKCWQNGKYLSGDKTEHTVEFHFDKVKGKCGKVTYWGRRAEDPVFQGQLRSLETELAQVEEELTDLNNFLAPVAAELDSASVEAGIDKVIEFLKTQEEQAAKKLAQLIRDLKGDKKNLDASHTKGIGLEEKYRSDETKAIVELIRRCSQFMKDQGESTRHYEDLLATYARPDPLLTIPAAVQLTLDLDKEAKELGVVEGQSKGKEKEIE